MCSCFRLAPAKPDWQISQKEWTNPEGAGHPEIDFGVAPARTVAGKAIIAGILLRAEALHAAPRIDQRAVDREMIARQQPSDLRLGQD
jgi:hypothetical protein